LTVLGLLVLLAGGAVWVLWFSTLLVLRTVVVTGSTIRPDAEIRQVAALPIGRPLVAVDLDAARQRVAGLPSVAQVRVRREWPHTVRITVQEREAVALVPDGDRYAEVDRSGVRFNTVNAVPPGVPLVLAPPGTTHAALDAALAVATTLPPSTLRQVRSITASGPNDVTLTLSSAAVVHWGGPTDTGRKAQVLGLLLRTGARSYDVSAPDAPAYR
jgi:cell division protein FtsQ